MQKAKTIQIFLPDGSPRSIRIATITTAIGQAILIPRNKIKEVAARESVHYPGIYFLFGELDDVGKREVYIGEAEDCYKRINQHNNEENEFWTTAVVFVSKINNLNNKHTRGFFVFVNNKNIFINFLLFVFRE